MRHEQASVGPGVDVHADGGATRGSTAGTDAEDPPGTDGQE
jgi:hypothetical protein